MAGYATGTANGPEEEEEKMRNEIASSRQRNLSGEVACLVNLRAAPL